MKTLNPKELDLSKVLVSLYKSSVVCDISQTEFEGTIEILIKKKFTLDGLIKDKELTSEYVGMELARTVDRDIFKKLLQYVPKSNKGNTAGVQSTMFNLGTINQPSVINKNNILDAIVDMSSCMYEHKSVFGGVWDNGWVALHPSLLRFIRKKDLEDGNPDPLARNGAVGAINDMTIYASNDVPVVHGVGSSPVYCIPFGRKNAFAFACNVKKGRLLYGEKVLKKESLGVYHARV